MAFRPTLPSFGLALSRLELISVDELWDVEIEQALIVPPVDFMKTVDCRSTPNIDGQWLWGDLEEGDETDADTLFDFDATLPNGYELERSSGFAVKGPCGYGSVTHKFNLAWTVLLCKLKRRTVRRVATLGH